jgi:hypothetical protein
MPQIAQMNADSILPFEDTGDFGPANWRIGVWGGVFGVEAGEAGLVLLELILGGGVFGIVFHAADAWGRIRPPATPRNPFQFTSPSVTD